MEPLRIDKDLTIPSDYLSVSFTRDLGEEGGPVAARNTPTAVELRLDVKGCEVLSPQDRDTILAYPDIVSDRRGTVRVTCSRFKSRRQNLQAARGLLADSVYHALAGHPPLKREETGEPARRPRRGGAGLIKRRGRAARKGNTTESGK